MTEAAENLSSVPGFGEFTPEPIAWQDEALDQIMTQYNYRTGVHECLFSGSYGSAKTMLLAHIAVFICLKYNNALGLIARRTLPDLRKTLFKKIVDHLKNDPQLKEGVHYVISEIGCNIKFPITGSEIIARTWHDKNHTKNRSLDLTFALFEEAIEMDSDDFEYYKETRDRVGRTAHIPFALCVLATNPGDPEHWIYEYFKLDLDEDPENRDMADVGERPETRHVFYSLTEENKFLPDWYLPNLIANHDPEEVERLVRGRWKTIRRTVIYHQYQKPLNFRNEAYTIDEMYPVRVAWDFNIGDGKPLSAVIFQFIPRTNPNMAGLENLHYGFHFFDQVVIEGLRTAGSFDEIADSGLLDVVGRYFIIHGDATGRRRDTRNNRSDWQIIEDCFANYTFKRDGQEHRLRFKIDVGMSNPAIRDRHNRVNAWLCNGNGDRRAFVYPGAYTLDRGFRLTKLKEGSKLAEDDSKDYQHITTAAGYGIVSVDHEIEESTSKSAVYY